MELGLLVCGPYDGKIVLHINVITRALTQEKEAEETTRDTGI